jgi:hypothetical protein
VYRIVSEVCTPTTLTEPAQETEDLAAALTQLQAHILAAAGEGRAGEWLITTRHPGIHPPCLRVRLDPLPQ